jgi:hypothetical protein
MKKILFAFALLFSQLATADVGLFYDDTYRIARTGLIQQAFPENPVYRCRTYTSCDRLILANFNIALAFSNFKKMKAEITRRKKAITFLQVVHVVSGPGYFIKVYDAGDVDGRGYTLFYIKAKNKRPATNQAIALTLIDEITDAYARAGIFF